MRDLGAYALNRPQYRLVGLQWRRQFGQRIKRGAAIIESPVQHRQRRFLLRYGTVHKNVINFNIFANDIEMML